MRIDALGLEMRHATDDEVKKMSRRLEESMEAGAIGMSTGLQYVPGSQSATSELVELGKVLASTTGFHEPPAQLYEHASGGD